MTRIGTMLTVAAALAIGAILGGGGLVQARLGTGAEAIGGAAPDIASSEAPQSTAPRAVGTCVTNRTAFRTQTNEVSTSDPTFAVMPNTHFPVTHTAGCLIVDFVAAVTNASSSDRMIIRAWIGGIGAAEPPLALLGKSVGLGSYETRSMRFVFPNVPAGTHTIRIDWRNEAGAIPIFAKERTLTVQYR